MCSLTNKFINSSSKQLLSFYVGWIKTDLQSSDTTCMIRFKPIRMQFKIKLFISLFSSLVIRGDKDERAVLCSGDKTYDLKIADTSNLLLFVLGCRTPDQLTNSQESSHVAHAQVWKWPVYCDTHTNTTGYIYMYISVTHID